MWKKAIQTSVPAVMGWGGMRETGAGEVQGWATHTHTHYVTGGVDTGRSRADLQTLGECEKREGEKAKSWRRSAFMHKSCWGSLYTPGEVHSTKWSKRAPKRSQDARSSPHTVCWSSGQHSRSAFQGSGFESDRQLFFLKTR